ncbi:MAG: DUF692 family multinuclear iron-containing protein [Anaerolineaceae bacterium]
MIQLGMTDCPAVRRLKTQNALHLDYLEVHGPYLEDARRVYPDAPMLLHNALYQWSLVHPDGLKHRDCACLTQSRLALARSPWYSLHLGFSSETVDFLDTCMVGTSPVLAPEQIFERTLRTLTGLIDLLPVPILVENMDYNPGGAYETICQPEFIRRVVNTASVGLLLDLAHAQISAAALDLPVREYLLLLPLERVGQIHVNHPEWNGARLWDAHEALQEEDYELLEWSLARCQPRAVTLEYNRDEAQILTQVGRLRQMLGAEG